MLGAANNTMCQKCLSTLLKLFYQVYFGFLLILFWTEKSQHEILSNWDVGMTKLIHFFLKINFFLIAF